MNELSYQKSYEEYKKELDTELQKTAESFVRIGYLLKVARDTSVLHESGYKNVTEFAQAEYGIDKTQVSRFIHINDKFSEGGYSDHLLPDFQGYGHSKLTLMLALPDGVIDNLSPNYSKAEIQAIKEEVEKEAETTPIERALEPVDFPNEPLINRVIMKLAETDFDLYRSVMAAENDIEDIMAPNEEKTYAVRIPREGTLLLMLDTTKKSQSLVSARTGETLDVSWEEISDAWEKIIDQNLSPEANYEALFGSVPVTAGSETKKESKVEKAKEKPKVAPVQHKNEPKAEESVTETQEIVTKEPESVTETPENHQPQEEAESTVSEQQTIEEETAGNPVPAECEVIQGQAEIEEYPEALPEKKGESDEERTVRGYRAAVTSNLRKLNHIWESEDEGKVELMLKELKDLEWRLNKIKELEG